MLSKFLLILIAVAPVADPDIPGPHSPKVQLASMATEVDGVIYNRVMKPRFGDAKPQVSLRQVIICRKYMSVPKPVDGPHPKWIPGMHVSQYVLLRNGSLFRVEKSGDKWFITFDLQGRWCRVMTRRYQEADTTADLEQLDLLAVPNADRIPYSLLR